MEERIHELEVRSFEIIQFGEQQEKGGLKFRVSKSFGILKNVPTYTESKRRR